MGDGKSVAAAGLVRCNIPHLVSCVKALVSHGCRQGAKLGSKPTCPAAHHSSFKSNGPLLRENEGARFPGNNAGTCCFVIFLPPHLPGFQNCLLGKIHYEGNLRQFCTDCLGCRLKLKLSKRAIRISTTPGVSRCQNGMRCYPLHLGGLGHYEGNLGHFSTDCLGQSRLPDTVPALFRDLQGANGMAWARIEALNRATRVSGVLARFRDIDFNGYRHCVYGIQQGNTRAETLSFGKEIEEHTIQQGSVRVNNGMQQKRRRTSHSDLPAIVKETKVIGVKGRDLFK
ncbi:hypothetical protein R3P38DRAFT_2814563 [Favolaschia claudopus]|uniref:Uncharacterized protein n=1 Tax=Favolaschia claudopus TaxID=2862362 RepID=A0AAV9Z398_9AGAR